MQSIRTRRLIKTRKIQIRKVWNSIRSRNRYRFVFFFCSKNRSFYHINLQISFASIEIKILNKIFIFVISYFLFSLFFWFRIYLFTFIVFVRTFLFLSWSNWYLNHNQWISLQYRSIKEVIYSLRNEIWEKRKNNVTNMFWKKFRLSFILSARILMWINVDLTHIFIFDIRSSCTYLFFRLNIFVFVTYSDTFHDKNVVDTQIYRLKLLFRWRIHSIFHVFLLKKYHINEFTKSFAKIVLINDHEKWKIKKNSTWKKNVSIFDSLKKIFIMW